MNVMKFALNNIQQTKELKKYLVKRREGTDKRRAMSFRISDDTWENC